MIRLFVFTVLFLSSVSSFGSLYPELNPGCSVCQGNDTTLVYVKAQDDDTTLHQVWDFTGHIPSILFIVGKNNASTVDIGWDGNKPTEILTNGSDYSFAMILTNIIEYNDTADRGYFDYNDSYREVSLHGVGWRLADMTLTSNEARVRLRGELPHRLNETRGHVDIELVALPYPGKSEQLPRLLHSIRSTQVDVSLEGVRGSGGYRAGRFALRYVLASTDDVDPHNFACRIVRSIDDEYTPGVFERVVLATPHPLGAASAYVEMRPVAYSARERGVPSSIPAKLEPYNRAEIPPGLVEKFYHNRDKKPVSVELIASFGQSGDGFYKQTNYTAWTYVVGYGEPPMEMPSWYLWFMVGLLIGTPFVGLFFALCAGQRYIMRSMDVHRAREKATHILCVAELLPRLPTMYAPDPPRDPPAGTVRSSDTAASDMELQSLQSPTNNRICILSYVFLGVGVLPNAHVRILTPPPEYPDLEEVEDML